MVTKAGKNEERATDQADLEDQVQESEQVELVSSSDTKQTETDSADNLPLKQKRSRLLPARFYKWVLKHAKLSIPLFILFIILVLGLIPWTRYKLTGLVIEQKYTVAISDSQTGLPVSRADIQLDGITIYTNNQGKATIKAHVGSHLIAVSKQYYRGFSQEVTVPILKPKHIYSVSLQATGRQVPLTVVDQVDGTPLNNALVKVDKTAAQTNAKGTVTIVLPADKKELSATISANGYNSQTATIEITTNSVPQNTFHLTPGGKLFFLSNATGTIDVNSVNLDGSNLQTVLTGTGE